MPVVLRLLWLSSMPVWHIAVTHAIRLVMLLIWTVRLQGLLLLLLSPSLIL